VSDKRSVWVVRHGKARGRGLYWCTSYESCGVQGRAMRFYSKQSAQHTAHCIGGRVVRVVKGEEAT